MPNHLPMNSFASINQQSPAEARKALVVHLQALDPTHKAEAKSCCDVGGTRATAKLWEPALPRQALYYANVRHVIACIGKRSRLNMALGEADC